MHDINNFDQRGLPGIFIASSAFVPAAAAQSTALGFAAPSVFVAHPIQDRTDDEMRVLADGAVDEIVAAIMNG